MNPKPHSPFLATLAGLAFTSVAFGQTILLSDSYESYGTGSSVPKTSLYAFNGLSTVLDEGTAAPFGSPNQYVELDDSSSSGSIRLQSNNITEASGALTTFAFDFQEPSSGGGSGLIVGYALQNLGLNTSGHRLRFNLDDGTLTGLSTAASNTYSLDSSYRLYVIFNDTASAVSYSGGSIPAGVAHIWMRPAGGSAVFAGTRNAGNSQTASYRVGFRTFSSQLQDMLVDNVTLVQGVDLPGNFVPELVSTDPADDASDAMIDANLVATFDEPILPGTGSVTLTETGGATVGTYDVTSSPNLTFGGSTLTIDPTGDLALGTAYHVLIDGTALRDLGGDNFAGLFADTAWNFTTASDAAPPSISSTSPVDDASGVALGDNLVATFDEIIAEGSGNIVISNLTEGNTFATISVADASQVMVSGNTLTIDPTSDLREGRSYAVAIDPGTVTDAVGNAFVGVFGDTSWNFETIPDATNPTLASTNPSDGAGMVGLTSNLVATFDEPVQAGSGNIVIQNLTDSSVFATIAVTDGSQVSFSGSSLTINPSSDLDASKDYAVQIAAGAVNDLSGNPYGGMADTTTWNFTTTQITSQDTILGEKEAGFTTPLGYYTNSGANTVGTEGPGGERRDRNLVIGFALPTLPVGETLDSADLFFEITEAFDNSGGAGANLPDLHLYLLDTANADVTDTSFFFHGPSDPNPDVALAGTTSVTLTSGTSTSFGDDEEDRTIALGGEALALLQSFYGGDNVPEQAEAWFRFNLSEDPAITSYRRYRIDLADNESGLTTTSAVAAPPVIVQTSPADDEIGVGVDSNLVATFSEGIVAGAGNILIRDVTNSTIFSTIAVTDAGQVTVSGLDLIIDPSTDLAEGTEYAVQLDAGVVADFSGNNFAGILSPDVTTWNFVTEVIAPQGSADRIIGRRQASGAALGYYLTAGDGRVGIGGSSGSRTDQVMVLGFTLPTLPVGTTPSEATLEFEIEAYRNWSGAATADQPALDTYLLDTANADVTDTSFFFQGPSDPNPEVAFVGSTALKDSGTGTVTYADDEQDQTYAVTGDALALLQGFYGGDHIPDQAEVWFRFNLDKADLGGATLANFDRYLLDTAANESSLTIGTTAGTSSPYELWAASFIPNPGGPNENPDGDLSSNLLEFAFGTNPNVSDPVALSWDGSNPATPGSPLVSVTFPSGGGVDFKARFLRRKDHGTAGSVSYTWRFSSDLTDWESSADTPGWFEAPIDVADDTSGAYDLVEIPYPFFLDTGKKAQYFQIIVTAL